MNLKRLIFSCAVNITDQIQFNSGKILDILGGFEADSSGANKKDNK